MSNMTKVIIGIVLPFLGTTLGSATVFFLKKEMNSKLQNLLRGFAAGVMVAASIWSLLIPAMEEAEAAGTNALFPVAGGLALGVGFLMLMDELLPHLHPGAKAAEGVPTAWRRSTLLTFAVTLHNIPEGMAVGLAFALVSGGEGFAGAAALAMGIGIQNFPEGAAVALPLRQGGWSRPRAFVGGMLSGAVEPVFGVLAALAAAGVDPLMPWLLSFAAGAMLYVVVEELIPEMSQGRHSNLGTVFFAVGFSVMMVLDVALG